MPEHTWPARRSYSRRPRNLRVLSKSLRTESVVAAIHREIRPGDERRVVTQQEEDRPGDFHRMPHSTEHVKLAPNRVPPLAVTVGGLVDFTRPYPSRTHAIHPNPMRREIERRAPRELRHRALGQIVRPTIRLRHPG